MGRECEFFTMLRHPIDRAISACAYGIHVLNIFGFSCTLTRDCPPPRPHWLRCSCESNRTTVCFAIICRKQWPYRIGCVGQLTVSALDASPSYQDLWPISQLITIAASAAALIPSVQSSTVLKITTSKNAPQRWVTSFDAFVACTWSVFTMTSQDIVGIISNLQSSPCLALGRGILLPGSSVARFVMRHGMRIKHTCVYFILLTDVVVVELR